MKEENKLDNKMSNDWTQQDLSFKIACCIEDAFDVKYAQTDVYVNAYQIEGSIHSAMEALGLKLVIADREKFNKSLVEPFDV